MSKLDFKKSLKQLYAPSAKDFVVVEVPPINYLMLDGVGDPNTAPAYGEAVTALYSLAFALKFAAKKQFDADYTVMPLECLWWTSADQKFDLHDRNNWRWTMMVMQPEAITRELFMRVLPEVQSKKQLPALSKIRLECMAEGLAVQIMYVGAYADELPTIERMYQHMEANGYEHNGKHHEIYLNDPARVAPEKLKTVIRQPIRHV